MMQEIERKYLVSSEEFRSQAVRCVKMAQGYICHHRTTARIRIADDEAYLTFKGKSRNGGLSRFEWERRIPASVGRLLLERCRLKVEKCRYYVPYEGYTFEVDLFEGDNAGLIVAEVELQRCDENPPLPQWIWKEVTGSKFYHNSMLAQFPYKLWGGAEE